MKWDASLIAKLFLADAERGGAFDDGAGIALNWVLIAVDCSLLITRCSHSAVI